ncbi:MAG: AAA family ATPase [Paludibacteraceae bacterium]|nr:AAA family ATPase [Paludibacteraceae bacterium]
MNTNNSFVIIKNQPKTLQIDKIWLEGNGVYAVCYKTSSQVFHYRPCDVVWLKNAKWHDHLNAKVFINGRQQYKVSDIRSFAQGTQTHWRITFSNGYVQDYLHGTISVIESCLGDDKAKNVFEYLERIAAVNELGKDEDHGGILSSLYQNIDFVEDTLSAAPYLNPKKYKVRSQKSEDLIFPFGCNASQKKAVTAAFENQISVIQGPPGTGKTQTILNIIANILIQGKTVMVVSNNNSATTNVLEKLEKFGLAFIVAPLGRKENKEVFIQNQPSIPQELQSWEISVIDRLKTKREISSILSQLVSVFDWQEELASNKQEIKSVELEWKHFQTDNNGGNYSPKRGIKAKRFMQLWLQYQDYAEGYSAQRISVFEKLKRSIKWKALNFVRKYLLGVHSSFDKTNVNATISELQALYYIARLRELTTRIAEIEGCLKTIDSNSLTKDLSAKSLNLLKDSLYGKYHNSKRRVLTDVIEISQHSGEFCKQYPIVLSTTFSARTAIANQTFDYLIMDEASQVSIDTGFLALTCAENAVVVGDTMQLPNVVTDDDKMKLNGIFAEYKVAQGYNCANYSFLQSVCAVIPNVKQTLLREHYRCHPTIINFCNQRFYGGNLLIMTKDNGEKDVMMAVKTAPGHHVRNHFNQREIDVVKEEVLPNLDSLEDAGIITPYNNQVNEFNRQIPNVEAATIHKYQGREKDTIIMSVTDDQISEFSDDSNLINVAISRAKKRFCLVVSGNEQERKGNVSELLDYIAYNNLSVSDSKLNSIFDYLYTNYTKERIDFLANHKNVSEFDSENLTFALLENILAEYPDFNHLGILCHTPLRTIIREWSLLNDDEKKYISNYGTHIDFLIISHVSKKPILAIETDGYSFHNDTTIQHQRDMKKNHILELYGLPLLRLKTNESGEKERVVNALRSILQ